MNKPDLDALERAAQAATPELFYVKGKVNDFSRFAIHDTDTTRILTIDAEGRFIPGDGLTLQAAMGKAILMLAREAETLRGRVVELERERECDDCCGTGIARGIDREAHGPVCNFCKGSGLVKGP